MSWLSFVISVARVVEQLPNHQSIAGLIAEPYTYNTTKIGVAIFAYKYTKAATLAKHIGQWKC